MAKIGMTKAQRMAARWAPADGQREDFPQLDVTLWRYVKNGHYVACAYRGAKAKPDFHLRFGTPTDRENYIGQWLETAKREVEGRAKFKADYREQSEQFFASLQLGDIFYYTGGYEQTNAYFFEVVGSVKAGSAVVRPVEQNTVESAPQAMRGYAIPCKGKYGGPEQVFRTTKRIPTKWKEGQQVSVTWYG